DLLRELQRRDVSIFGCIARARRTIYETDLTLPAVLAIGGGEGGGGGGAGAGCRARFGVPPRPRARAPPPSPAPPRALGGGGRGRCGRGRRRGLRTRRKLLVRDQPRRAVTGEVVAGPLHQHQQAILKLDQLHQVNKQPENPCLHAGETEAAKIDNSKAAANRR